MASLALVPIPTSSPSPALPRPLSAPLAASRFAAGAGGLLCLFGLLGLLALAGPGRALAQEGAGASEIDLPAGPFGVLVSDAKSVRYAFTAEDAVWAARMLVGEAGGRDDPDSAAVLWSMLNSYAIRPVRGTYPTFASFVRAYCTPLQPWLKAQGAVDRHRRLGTAMEEVEPGKFQLVRHLELQRRPWSKLPESARNLALRVLSGQLQSVCGNATQFCSTAIYFHDKNRRRPNAEEHAAYTRDFAEGKKWTWIVPEGTNVMKNCFFEERRYADLPQPAVRVDAPAAPPARAKSREP